ncbi:unnamed protein product [Bursaphelenchus xylophilus]|uniref:(pine wood nematode) hypothetical protein n=1 Tax=Bursaphelenchus xylophilus TaxID=6326 RepID=A0A7I8WUH4_BURXY|nr:unnamed protein product [Bursaphelenchus xylophilus]CAG9116538.1 unnamed protein product [Bursaphelenchus xylophilus]
MNLFLEAPNPPEKERRNHQRDAALDGRCQDQIEDDRSGDHNVRVHWALSITGRGVNTWPFRALYRVTGSRIGSDFNKLGLLCLSVSCLGSLQDAVCGGGSTCGIGTGDGPRCVPIPSNFILCHGIQYNSMRLPTLLEHDTVEEAIQQSDAWNSLLRLHCHPETKLFLCSLFAPVCLSEVDKIIYPCKSLCEKVKQGCEPRMKQYGFDWPEMMRCSKFPEDNDMCIKPQASEEIKHSQSKRECASCVQIPTFENLLDNFCSSNTVFKAKLSVLNGTLFKIHRVQRVFKPRLAAKKDKEAQDNHKFLRPSDIIQVTDQNGKVNQCHCPQKVRKGPQNYLIMTDNKMNNILKARLLLPWQQDKVFKNAIKKFNKVDCNSLGREIRESAMKRSRNGY